MARYISGTYRPQHPDKYRGDVKNIIYRSSWELAYLRRLDMDESVVQYSSEELIIAYKHPVSNTVRRYFVDFCVTRKDKDGVVRTEMIEIKPLSQTKPPVAGKKSKRTLLNEQITYAVNMAKWEAADRFAKQRGWEFKVLTEKQLGIVTK